MSKGLLLEHFAGNSAEFHKLAKVSSTKSGKRAEVLLKVCAGTRNSWNGPGTNMRLFLSNGPLAEFVQGALLHAEDPLEVSPLRRGCWTCLAQTEATWYPQQTPSASKDQEGKRHISSSKSSGHWPEHPAGQTAVYRPASRGFTVVCFRKTDRKGHFCRDTGRVSRPGVLRDFISFFLMCLLCSLKELQVVKMGFRNYLESCNALHDRNMYS